MLDGIKNLFSGMKKGMRGMGKSMSNGLKSGLRSMQKGLKGGMDAMGKGLKSFGNLGSKFQGRSSSTHIDISPGDGTILYRVTMVV